MLIKKHWWPVVWNGDSCLNLTLADIELKELPWIRQIVTSVRWNRVWDHKHIYQKSITKHILTVYVFFQLCCHIHCNFHLNFESKKFAFQVFMKMIDITKNVCFIKLLSHSFQIGFLSFIVFLFIPYFIYSITDCELD